MRVFWRVLVYYHNPKICIKKSIAPKGDAEIDAFANADHMVKKHVCVFWLPTPKICIFKLRKVESHVETWTCFGSRVPDCVECFPECVQRFMIDTIRIATSYGMWTSVVSIVLLDTCALSVAQFVSPRINRVRIPFYSRLHGHLLKGIVHALACCENVMKCVLCSHWYRCHSRSYTCANSWSEFSRALSHARAHLYTANLTAVPPRGPAEQLWNAGWWIPPCRRTRFILPYHWWVSRVRDFCECSYRCRCSVCV